MVPFSKIFDYNLRSDYQKNFLWVGRRKELIFFYVPKNDEKRIQEEKGQ